MGLISKKKTEALYAELNETAQAATGNFYNIFILCLRLQITRRSNQGVQFSSFPS